MSPQSHLQSITSTPNIHHHQEDQQVSVVLVAASKIQIQDQASKIQTSSQLINEVISIPSEEVEASEVKGWSIAQPEDKDGDSRHHLETGSSDVTTVTK